MDKNTVTAFVLMALVLFGFSYFNQPSQEEIATYKKTQDSIAAVAMQKQQAEASQKLADERLKENADSAKAVFGDFGASMKGNNSNVVLKNDLMTVEISTKGGIPSKVTLNNYQTYDKQPLVLFQNDENKFNIEMPASNGKIINTDELYFTPTAQTDSSVTLKVNAGDGMLDFTYVLHKGSYLVDYNITTYNLKGTLTSNKTTRLKWESVISKKEKSATFESRYAELSYKYHGSSSVDNLSAMGSDDEFVEDPIHWVAFKDQYFSSVLIADSKPMANAKLNSENMADNKDAKYVQHYNADIQLGFDVTDNQTNKFHYFFGPNKYKLLSSYDDNLSGDEQMKLKKLVPLGWFLFRIVNQFVVIPLFNFLENFISNYGLLIFLLTLIIKLILLPLTYKSYLSTAKMRVLKPEIDRLTKDIPAENTMERQQVTMQVYSKAGASPMGGCLPMLLSMPILIAMFTFFPTAIELRGKSFLWADDLSAYDSILDFGFNIPFYGDHVSLFCLLMTVVNIVYTKFNMQMTDTGAQQQMPGMKYMMYFMPIMFLFMFNDYASGLTYYYFVSLLITIVQTVLIRYSINDVELLRKLNEKAEKNQKSGNKGLWQRIAEAQEMQRKMMEEQNKNK